MKYFLYTLLVLLALSCIRDEVGIPDESVNPEGERVRVSLALEGELVDFGEEPVSRADGAGNDLYWIQVDIVNVSGASGAYAYGIFDTLKNMSLDLLKGFTYNISASLIKDGKDKLHVFQGDSYEAPVTSAYALPVTNRFVVANDAWVTPSEPKVCMSDSYSVTERKVSFPEIDRYHGRVEKVAPEEGMKISLNMQRMMWGIHLEIDPFPSGEIVISKYDFEMIIPASGVAQVMEKDMQWGFGQLGFYPDKLRLDLDIRWRSEKGDTTVDISSGTVFVERLKRLRLKVNVPENVIPAEVLYGYRTGGGEGGKFVKLDPLTWTETELFTVTGSIQPVGYYSSGSEIIGLKTESNMTGGYHLEYHFVAFDRGGNSRVICDSDGTNPATLQGNYLYIIEKNSFCRVDVRTGIKTTLSQLPGDFVATGLVYNKYDDLWFIYGSNRILVYDYMGYWLKKDIHYPGTTADVRVEKIMITDRGVYVTVDDEKNCLVKFNISTLDTEIVETDFAFSENCICWAGKLIGWRDGTGLKTYDLKTKEMKDIPGTKLYWYLF